MTADVAGPGLTYNVAALLRDAPGSTRTFSIDVPDMPIAEDLEVAGPITGEVHLMRTGRGVLARGSVQSSLALTCVRCLRPMVAPIEAEIEEEALPSIDIDTGVPVDTAEEPDVLRLDDHHELDLGDTVRAAISLAEPIAPLCRPDCRGLCLECGTDLNDDPSHHHADDEIDPRLAALADILDKLD
jgi:uncharacterized protein